MTTLLFILVLVALTAVAVLWPLWRRETDVLTDFGREVPDAEDDILVQRNRNLEALRDLEISHAEGKIDETTYVDERQRLTREAEQTLSRRRRKRDEARQIPIEQAQTYKTTGIAAGALLLVSTLSLAVYFNSNDVARESSPHASGQIRLDQDAMAGRAPNSASPNGAVNGMANAPIIGPDGAPDPKAMVRRLEKKIATGEPTPQDIAMLARSYRVLGREKEVLGLYKSASEKAPDNPDILLMYGMSLFDSGTDPAQKQAYGTFDHILKLRPDMPEALWFKSLIHVKRHEIEPAKVILKKLQGLVENNPAAKKAVASLLTTLNANLAPAQGNQPSETDKKSTE